jgi:ubiquinone/menaquinone biosynthesis C-methylase UbiE
VVVDIGGGSLSRALEEAGPDGDVIVVDDSVDVLERLRRDCEAPNVSFLIGNADVLPLPDACVDSVLGAEQGDDLGRVLRHA